MATANHPTASVSLNAGRPAYVPPYLRARQAAEPVKAAPAPAAFNGAAPTPTPAGNGYRPSPTGLPTPAPTPVPARGSYVPPVRAAGSDDGGWGAGPRRAAGGGGGDRSFERGTAPGVGAWRDGKHVPGARNPRLEKELYGEEGDGSHQVSGKN